MKTNLPKENTTISVTHPILTKTKGSQPADNVHCSLQDKASNLWFGTTGEGVYKYDGKSFSQFSASNGLKSNMINHIMEDKNGKIWIGTAAGAYFFDGKTFVEVKIPLIFDTPATKHDVFSIMQAKSGKLWFATINGVYVYDGKSFIPFAVNEGVSGYMNEKNNVEYILEDKSGNIWFGGRGNKGVFYYDGKTLTNLKPNGDSWAWPALEDKQGYIWFSNWNGAYRYDGKSFTSFTKEDGLSGAVTRIIEDRKGNLWFGGGNSGICRYDAPASPHSDSHMAKEKSFTCFTTKDGLINNDVWSILEDKKGNLWIGTRNTGLSRYDGKGFIAFSEKSDISLFPQNK
ncbi:hypothetical protein H1R81_13610 [Emticicia sp. BO119]|nr:hypothetical protein [Emticicia sp. BO119]